jgi:hypothetical protein
MIKTTRGAYAPPRPEELWSEQIAEVSPFTFSLAEEDPKFSPKSPRQNPVTANQFLSEQLFKNGNYLR